MHFISSEKRKMVSSVINASYATGNLFLVKADWKLKKDPAVPNAVNRCTFTCGAVRLSVSDVLIIRPVKHSIS